MNYIVFALLVILTCSQPSTSSSSSDDSDDYIQDVIDLGLQIGSSVYVTNSHSDITDTQSQSSWKGFFIVVAIFFILCVIYGLMGKKKEEDVFLKKQEYLITKKCLNKSESIQRLEELRIKIKQFKVNLVFNFEGEDCQTVVFSIRANLNDDVLEITIDGRDKYGTWSKGGCVILNYQKQLECVLQKIYDNREEIQGDDTLIYPGEFLERDQSFKGFWYYTKGKTSGAWTLKFTTQRNLNNKLFQ